MDDIKDVTVEPLTSSQFVKPYRMHYKQNNVEKIWDLVSLHESVSIIIFNTDRKKLVLVKQFRPAVYYGGIPREERKLGSTDTSKYPGSAGLTIELCAGIVDKTKDLAQTAKEEVLEECGYEAPLESFEKVLKYRSGVGVSGDQQTVFYVEVTDKMKVSQGGGLADEGEMIEVVEMSIPEVQQYLSQPEVNSPGGLLFGLMWFLNNKAPKE
ncbi:uridine diphosphate glucose pyrophosphatase NUDT14-like [Penaeus indicus]|uniref:uridine diphosphate glucose pyrophosphatase NUDT14-like n=1 Tax=Penaeus indicus TaxID=29960 RepID=UPI00300C103A